METIPIGQFGQFAARTVMEYRFDTGSALALLQQAWGRIALLTRLKLGLVVTPAQVVIKANLYSV